MTRAKTDGPDVTFIVPVRDDAAGLTLCLESIRRASAGWSAEVVVADNGSMDDSAAVGRNRGATVLGVPGLRVGAVRNEAARAARGGVLAFVDADHEISPQWLGAALDVLRDPAVAAVGAPYSSPVETTWVERIYGAFRSHGLSAHTVGWLGAGNLAVRRDVFERVGGFDPSLEACEDVDLCLRLRRAGLRIVSDPRLASVHHGDPRTLGALFVSELWRGRDNLKVTLRGPLTPGDLPSVVIPVVDLLALAIVVASPVLPSGGVTATVGAAVFLGFAGLRAFRLLSRLATPGALDIGRAFLVACAYDAARALALVLRIPHRRTLVVRRSATAVSK